MLTPADPFSMVLMAVPLVAMYEISILVAKSVTPVSASTAHGTVAEEEQDL